MNSSRRCPNCAATPQGEDLYCPNCGSRLPTTVPRDGSVPRTAPIKRKHHRLRNVLLVISALLIIWVLVASSISINLLTETSTTLPQTTNTSFNSATSYNTTNSIPTAFACTGKTFYCGASIDPFGRPSSNNFTTYFPVGNLSRDLECYSSSLDSNYSAVYDTYPNGYFNCGLPTACPPGDATCMNSAQHSAQFSEFPSGIPTGIVDYGFTNDTGTLIPYKIDAKTVFANVTVNSLDAYSGDVIQAAVGNASLQLNLALQVNSTQGTKVYWLQNVVTFGEMIDYNNQDVAVSNDTYFKIGDNIWNASGPPSNRPPIGPPTLDPLNLTYVNGSDWLCSQFGYICVGGPSNVYLSAYHSGYFRFPFSFNLLVTASAEPNGVQLKFGYQLLNGASPLCAADPRVNPYGCNPIVRDNHVLWNPVNQTQVVYDTVFISNNNTTAATILIDGHSYSPFGLANDAELVFCGPGNYAHSYFVGMNSTLSMHYVLPNGTVIPPPTVWQFGVDTAEAAFNLKTILSNGNFVVVTGVLEYNDSYSLSQGKN